MFSSLKFVPHHQCFDPNFCLFRDEMHKNKFACDEEHDCRFRDEMHERNEATLPALPPHVGKWFRGLRRDAGGAA
jgi:hypothetical protein